jgi:hypothetical protein
VKHDISTHSRDRVHHESQKIKFTGTDTSRISLNKHRLGVAGGRASGSIRQVFRYISDQRRAAAMEISNFKNMYLAELQELVSVEGPTRRRIAAYGGGCFASGTEAPAASSSRGNRNPKRTVGDHPAEAWCQSHGAYRPGDAGARHREQENADH